MDSISLSISFSRKVRFMFYYLISINNDFFYLSFYLFLIYFIKHKQHLLISHLKNNYDTQNAFITQEISSLVLKINLISYLQRSNIHYSTRHKSL